jgi:CspA family cold shock protein
VTSLGTVSQWSHDEGWGVIASDDTPGGCWAHFSSLEMQGYHSLTSGESVEFDWEEADQDGFGYRAVRVWPTRPCTAANAARTESATPAYRATLTITPDEAV